MAGAGVCLPFRYYCMRFFSKNIIGWQVQLLVWLLVFVLHLTSNLQYDSLSQASVYALVATLFYAAIMYSNASWLIPQFYYRRKYIIYVLLLAIVLVAAVAGRTVLMLFIYNTFYAVKKETLSTKAFTYSSLSAVFILLFSYFFRLALNYFTLSKKQAEIKAAQAQTELSLLKQQLHPHFLFNTLNNIYYVAGKDSPEAADLIERLSGIMRYFIEEAKKEKVFLKDEVALLKSYIELESIRMRYEMPIQFTIDGNISNTTVPPLLLMPLAENIFKHGVDKRSTQNFTGITLTVNNGRLTFGTANNYYAAAGNGSSKTGLANLQKRLQLYYDNDYTLTARRVDGTFVTTLNIPVHED